MNPPQSIRPGNGGDDDPPKVVDRADLAERRTRRAELGEQMQARRAAEAEALVAELSSEVARLEAEVERAVAGPARSEERLAEARRALRAAEQRAHAERRRRLEATEEGAARLNEVRERAARERARADAGREALREAQEEGERLRRRVAEAEQAVATAAAARRRGEPAPQPRAPRSSAPFNLAAFGAERAFAEAAAQAKDLRPALRVAAVGPPLGLEGERRLIAARTIEARGERMLSEARELTRDMASRLEMQHRVVEGARELGDELRRERAARQVAEAALAQQQQVTARVREALAVLREELALLRAEPVAVPVVPVAPPAPLPGLAELRDRLGALGGPASSEPTGSISVERLDEARARLRAQAEEDTPPAQAEALDQPKSAREPEPGTPSRPEPNAQRPPPRWLPAAIARLGEDEPAVAARLALRLLPALGMVAEEPVTFTFELDGVEPVSVDAAPGRAAVVAGNQPASGRKPEFRLAGSPEAVGRLLLAPSVRTWLLPPGRPRLRGRRKRAEVLRALVRAPNGFAELARVGVELDPELAYTLLARAIVPAWTAGHTFTIQHETTGSRGSRAFLSIRDGQAPRVSRAAPEGRAAATVACTPGALLPLLAGARLPEGERASIRGEAGAVALVQGWIARVQDESSSAAG
ncbi:MAG: hypothetical protein ACR2K9_07135 [Solirubrobacteraceae bacterium]